MTSAFRDVGTAGHWCFNGAFAVWDAKQRFSSQGKLALLSQIEGLREACKWRTCGDDAWGRGQRSHVETHTGPARASTVRFGSITTDGSCDPPGVII